MKTMTGLLLLCVLTAGCSVSSSEEASEGRVDAIVASADDERPKLELTGKSVQVDFVYDAIAPVETTAGQAIDVTNHGFTHLFGLYTASGEKLRTVNLPGAQTTPIEIAAAGDYQLTCEDCVDLSEEAKAAVDWPAFIALFQVGRATTPVRSSVTLHVR